MKSTKIVVLGTLLLVGGLFVASPLFAASHEDAAPMSDDQQEGDVLPSYEDDRSMPAYEDGAAIDQVGEEEVLPEDPDHAEEAPAR